jgi:hypothetical protein
MIDLLRLLCGALIGLLRSSTRREAEILVLRHQLNVLKRQAPKRPAFEQSRSVAVRLAISTVSDNAAGIEGSRAGNRSASAC